MSLVSSEDFEDSEIKENSELIFSTFHALLDLRGASGYSYESSYSREFFMDKAHQYIEPATQILQMVKAHINQSSN